MTKKITPAALTKMGGITMNELATRSGYSRQWLLVTFNQDREKFEKILFDEMAKDRLGVMILFGYPCYASNVVIEQCMPLSDLAVQPSCSHNKLMENLAPAAIYAEIDDANRVIVNDVSIEDNVFDNELVNYRLEDREELMDNLISWIAEARNDANRNSDFLLMKQDLFMLSELDDNYVWSSIETNEYVSASKTPVRFNEICQEVLEVNKDLITSQKTENPNE